MCRRIPGNLVFMQSNSVGPSRAPGFVSNNLPDDADDVGPRTTY